MAEAQSYPDLHVEQKNQVSYVTIDRADFRNSMTDATMRSIGSCLAALDADPETRVIVLTGRGEKAFCAGAHVGMFAQASVSQVNTQFGSLVGLWGTFRRLNKPVIARVNGAALGGGLALMMMCDVAIASETATFAVPEINAGIFPMTVLPFLIRNVGPRTSLELSLTGRRLTAADAHAIGLLNRVVPRDRLDAEVDAFAEEICAKSASTVRLGRQGFLAMRDLPLDAALDYAAAQGGMIVLTDDAKEGIQAFQERRPPVWKHA